jgi:hypothetical protein
MSSIPEDTTVRLPVDRALTTTVLLLTYVSSKLPLYLQVKSSGYDDNGTRAPPRLHPTSPCIP